MQAVLILENGARFVGLHFGAPVNTSGEVGKSVLLNYIIEAAS